MSPVPTATATATATLTVDLGAIVANWRLIAARTAPAVCAAVVKADAYGLGADRVAPALRAAGCDTFFVATIDEGIALRPLVGDAAIHVLCGPLPGSEGEFTAHDLIPVCNHLGQLAAWRAHAAALGRPLPAHLHLDTGMSRLGLEPAAVERLAAEPALLAGLAPLMVMSHMACADEPDIGMNVEQLAAFRRLSARLPQGRRSLAASSAIFLGPDYHFGMVRPGAALYGLNPTPGRANPMAQVVTLQGKILQVRDVDSPMTVGYGATHRITRPGRIATVAVGYADGYFRSLGGRGQGVIAGVAVPVVGRVSMDLTTFDVSAAPPEAVHPGAMIELIGTRHTADDMAAEAGTIGYEVLTALGRRHARTYVGGAA